MKRGETMNKDLFISRYKTLFDDDNMTKLAINSILTFEQFSNKDIINTTINDIREYMDHLIQTKSNKYNNVIHIARYYYYENMKEHYIHMTSYFNSLGVLEHIVERISLYENDETKNAIMNEIDLPPFGTDITDLPEYTSRFINTLFKHLPTETCNKILAGNNHQIPIESFNAEKDFYNQSPTFEDYLKNRHQRKVLELEQYYKNNQVWFEQIITKDVIDFVRHNPEVLSGVIDNDKLYITKIPYDINNFISAQDDKLKRYYACHCSFVRENILQQKTDIPQEWCYCSGGFAKHPFEAILGQELDVKLLSTPLNGDHLCRFEIDLHNIDYKK